MDTDGDYAPLQVDSSGALRVTGGGGGGGGTEFAEDSPAVGGELGTQVLGVRNDTGAVKTGADGDFSAFSTDSAGRVGVSDLGGSVTVDAVDLDIRNLLFASDKVDVSGSTVTIQEPLSVDDNGGSLTVDSPTLASENTLARRFGQLGRITLAQIVSTSGDNTIVTPALGNRLRVYWVGLSVPSSSEVVATVKFGALGTPNYIWDLGAFMHWETLEGGVNTALIVNLSAAVPTRVNITYEEFV